MITIANLRKMALNEKIGGGDYVVKTAKKRDTRPDGSQYQKLLLTDGTDEILAEINSGKGFCNGETIHVIVGIIKETHVSRNHQELLETMLLIDQFSQESVTVDEALGPYKPKIDYYNTEADVVRGKIRMHLVASYIQSGREPDKSKVLEWQEFIMTGKL